VPLGAGASIQEIVYKANGPNPGIYNQVLTADGLARHPELTAPYSLYEARSGWWHQGIVERPAIGVHDGHVYLYFAGGPPDTAGRAIGWSECRHGLGVVSDCRTGTNPAPLVAGTANAASPSGPQILTDGATSWLVYDGLPGGSCPATGACGGVRNLRIDKLCYAHHQPRTNAPTTTAQPLARSSDCRQDVPAGWGASWGSGMGPVAPGNTLFNLHELGGRTLRQFVHMSIGGQALRVTISNRFSTTPLRIGRATVATGPATDDATAAVAGPIRPLTFAGAGTVVVPAGAEVVSDPVTFAVPADRDLAVSLHLPQPTGAPTGMYWAGETSHVGPGDLTASTGAGFDTTTENTYYVAAVDVLGTQRGTVIALGDSLTDGNWVNKDIEGTWPDRLFDRLGPSSGLGVVNAGVAGNQLLPATNDQSGLGRFDRDVVRRSGASTVVVLLGTNDIGGQHRSAAAVVAGLQELITKAREAGLRVVGMTIPPFAGPGDPAPLATDEQTRLAVNGRIRPGRADSLPFDAVADMDAVLRNPATSNPVRVRPEYAWLGNFHPSLEGHRAMADAIDLATLG
jgi:lysophospholipase L1-like esterase